MNDTPESNTRQNAGGSDASFSVGDRATYTHSKSNGNSFNFSTRSGKIDEMGRITACVKLRNGRRDWVLLSRLRKEGERTELTEMVVGSPENATAQASADQQPTKSDHGK